MAPLRANTPPLIDLHMVVPARITCNILVIGYYISCKAYLYQHVSHFVCTIGTRLKLFCCSCYCCCLLLLWATRISLWSTHQPVCHTNGWILHFNNGTKLTCSCIKCCTTMWDANHHNGTSEEETEGLVKNLFPYFNTSFFPSFTLCIFMGCPCRVLAERIRAPNSTSGVCV